MVNSPVPRLRIMLVGAMLTGAFLLLILQLLRWQVLQGPKLFRDDGPAQVSQYHRGPERGTVVDRYGEPLAFDVYHWEVWIEPWLVGSEQEAADLATRLVEVLGPDCQYDWSQLKQLLASGQQQTVTIAKHASESRGEAIVAWGWTDGVSLQAIPSRFYPQRSLASHLLGFVNDEPKAYYGVEQYYDDYLRLTDDGFFRAEAGTLAAYAQLPSGWQRHLPSLAGQDLVLTIDRRIQYMVERELAEALGRYRAQSGTIIVMDPRNGAIWAMASLPAYDPNQFGLSDADLLADPAISEQYEPGSTFKIVTLAAGLDAGVITPETVITDTETLEIGGRVIQNWDKLGHGQVDIRRVLVSSLNIGAAQVALELQEKLFYLYVRRFGFGQPTEIDLANESPGTVKVPGDPLWSESDLATNAFGQGLAVTPLQMTAAASIIANGGLWVRPHVVEGMVYHGHVIAPEGGATRRVIKPETAAQMTDLMVAVVEDGAVKAQVEGYTVAGKTGTAQVAIQGSYHPTLTIASFVGFAPAENPEFVVLVKLDMPKASPWAVDTAAPVFANVMRQLLFMQEVPPDQLASKPE